MKIKSLLVILLLSLFSLALEAQLYTEGIEPISVEKEVQQTIDVPEEIEDDDRLFFTVEDIAKNAYPLVKKIDFHNTISMQEFSTEIHRPPIVL
ncbi:hypothetical protein [Sulfurimonas marina]|uniref:Uncharacterized protein n=1 Tax=Sulfurimonas marina TaxID=2590551 RepID=A0A7M1ATG4_9BACT|nr:hypothetical protein [Sulfurimonas marina]QOP40707.1 hypothetical protein FJR03_02690 [Sulfurimonas marina]